MAQMVWNDYWRLFYRSGAIMIAEVATGASCNDPTGEYPEDNLLERSSEESWQGPRADRPLTTSSVLTTQVAQMGHNDYEGFFY